MSDTGTDERAELAELLDDAWCNPMSADFDPSDPRWVSLPQDVRIGFLQAAQRLWVLERGWTAVGVFPTKPGGYHFCYTIGVEPAVIATGFSASGEMVLAAALEHADQPTGEVRVVGDGDDEGRFVFAPVPDDAFRRHATGAVREGATCARQFVLTDDDGRWPWDDGCELAGPVLAGPDWRPDR